MKLRGDQAVVEALKGEGVEYVFGLPGGHSCLILYDALYENPEVKPILCRHEESGAFEACGYTHVTNKVGLCHGTAGPGWGQLLPGVHEAYASRLPLIALCASVPTRYYGMGALQEFPQEQSMTPFCKWTYTVDRVEKIQWIMRRAFNIAATPPPGPVYINFPIDLGQETFDAEPYKPAPPVRSAGDPKLIVEAGERMLKADRLLIVAGRGVHASAAWKELRELAELLAVPVLTTNSGKGAIADNHPLAIGGVGINRTRLSEKVYTEADCMLWVGSQLEEWATGNLLERPRATFIYIDADPNQMSRNWVPDVGIVGDARLVLQQLNEHCRVKVQRRALEDYPRVKDIMKLKREYFDSVQLPELTPVHPGRLALTVSRLMPDDSITVLGEGVNRVWTAILLQVRKPGHWVSASDYGCMGFSVAASIGVKLGKPDNPVFCITGDGSFQMQMHELPVAVQYKAPVTWFIADDHCLGWIKWHQKVHGERYIAVDFDPAWRFDKVAEACGVEGILVERPGELNEAVTRAFRLNQEGLAVVVDVLTATVGTPNL